MIVHDLFSECMSPMIMHGDQTTYQTIAMYTTTVLHGENNLTMILPRSRQDLPTARTMDMTPINVGPLSPNFCIGGTHTLSPTCQNKKIG